MPRRSTKTDKNIYFTAREAAGLTREKASELMEYISDDRIERIESGKSTPNPDEILTMAKCYKAPLLVNQYCTKECPIGQKYVPEISPTDLYQIVVELFAASNSMNTQKERLVEICKDGIISDEEKPDFQKICAELERISIISGEIKLWLEDRI